MNEYHCRMPLATFVARFDPFVFGSTNPDSLSAFVSATAYYFITPVSQGI